MRFPEFDPEIQPPRTPAERYISAMYSRLSRGGCVFQAVEVRTEVGVADPLILAQEHAMEKFGSFDIQDAAPLLEIGGTQRKLRS